VKDSEHENSRAAPCLITCDVYRSALRFIGVDAPEGNVAIIYLPAHLHLRPDRLRRELVDCLASVTGRRTCAGCLYGLCFPDIDAVLDASRIERIACGHCYEILLGRDAYTALIEAQPGTFFVEKSLIEDFDNLCRTPLELDDPEMRQLYFEHYRQVVYIRQPLDRNLIGRARGIAEMLDLAFVVEDADYTDLRAFLKHIQIDVP
jgi:hypothetical protein